MAGKFCNLSSHSVRKLQTCVATNGSEAVILCPSSILSAGFFLQHILLIDVDGNQEAIRPFKLERLVPSAISFDFVRHHEETLVARHTPIFQVLNHDRLIGHSLKFIESDLACFSVAQLRVGMIPRSPPLLLRFLPT